MVATFNQLNEITTATAGLLKECGFDAFAQILIASNNKLHSESLCTENDYLAFNMLTSLVSTDAQLICCEQLANKTVKGDELTSFVKNFNCLRNLVEEFVVKAAQ